VGIRQPRNSAPIINDNSDVRERDGPKVNSDILLLRDSEPEAAMLASLVRAARSLVLTVRRLNFSLSNYVLYLIDS
jgi:hypothetical protein